MSWIMKLYETYENCQSEIGRITFREDGSERTPLLPIAHTTMIAGIEVTLNFRGECINAKTLNRKEGTTVIPCTEKSASRSGKTPVHHPLFDKLQYMAGDYEAFGGLKGRAFHEAYMSDLQKWCESEYANEKVTVIWEYLKRGQLMTDLVRHKVLICGEDGPLLEKWNGAKDEMPSIFKVLQGGQSDVAVRIGVTLPGDPQSELWKDPQVYQDYINYYLSGMEDKELCYASGEQSACNALHPKKIVPFEANAKLISSNDSVGFTYRGRFEEGGQVSNLSYEVSQKAHNALRWLIEKQGYSLDNECFLAWGTENEGLPPLMGDTADLIRVFENRPEEAEDLTKEEFAIRLNKALAGYKAKLDTKSQIIILAMMAATPGRLSITFYRDINGEQFMENVVKWHTQCQWEHSYGMTKEGKHFSFTGAPSPRDIVSAAYGSSCSDKLKKSTVERLLHCIVDGTELPTDLMQCTVRRASNLIAMDAQWERGKTLSIACALYKKYHFDKFGEVLPMSLNKERTDRSYLYGRLLAVADYMENVSYDKWGERTTNAMRYQNMFSQKPYRTWSTIDHNLNPYKDKLRAKLPSGGKYYLEQLEEINSMFREGDLEKEGPLEPIYLHGYYCQMKELREHSEQIKEAYALKNSKE